MTTNNNEIYVKVKSDGKIYRASAGNLELENLDEVLFDYDQFQDVGVVVDPELNKEILQYIEEDPITIIRKLNSKDKEKLIEKKEEAKSLLGKCEEKIIKHGLSMDLLDAEISYDGKKLTFYFTSSGRVDFRSLVPDLASTFKKLIRLQQVGSRDKAKRIESVGRCGRDTCCRKFLKGELENVCMDMAYDQNLGQSGSSRVSGVCGKLMCCLKYELESYQAAKKKMPVVGSRAKTELGEGRVISQNVVKNTIKVELSDKRILEVDC